MTNLQNYIVIPRVNTEYWFFKLRQHDMTRMGAVADVNDLMFFKVRNDEKLATVSEI